MPCTRRTCLFGTLAALLLAACVSQPPAPYPPTKQPGQPPPSALLGDPQAPYPLQAPPRVGDILHLRTGHLVSRDQMLAAATDQRIVYAAETHDNPASHRLQLDLIRAMAARYPGRTAVAMEMFTPAQQDMLDAWVSGELDEKGFLKRWYEGWTLDFDYYREILRYCREHGIPILGINAELSLVRAVGRQDFGDLSAAEQAQLPATLDLGDPYHRALTESVYGGHAHGGMLDGFQRVQTLWDEAMADNIVKFLGSGQRDDFHLVVLAGGNHVRNGFGIPRRVFRSLPVSYVLIGGAALVVSEAKRKQAYMNVTIPVFPMPAYDYLVYMRYEELAQPPEVKLGIVVAEKDGKLLVNRVFPGGTGALGGLREGDWLRQLDGETLTERFDLIYTLRQKKVGQQGRLLVEREGGEVLLELVYAVAPPAAASPHEATDE